MSCLSSQALITPRNQWLHGDLFPDRQGAERLCPAGKGLACSPASDDGILLPAPPSVNVPTLN